MAGRGRGRRPRGPGRIRRRRPLLRRRLLRHQPQRGAGDGPAAAHASGDVLGGAGAGGHRPGDPARQRHRRLRRGHAHRVRPRHVRHPRPHRRLPGHRALPERRLRTGLLRPRLRRPRGDRRHGLLLVPRGAALGDPGAAPGRLLARPRGRGDDDRHPQRLRELRRPQRARLRRPVQVLLRRCRRHRLGGGRRCPRRGTALGRPPQQPRGPGGGPGQRHQPPRCVQRPDVAQRALAGTPHPPGPRHGGTAAHRGGRGRGARHRHSAR